VTIDPDKLRDWLAVPTDELPARARIPVTVLDTPADVHRHCAEEMFEEIAAAAAAGRPLRVIVPIGPTAQYRLLADRINDAGLSLEHVTYFGMDQCLDWQARPLPAGHPFDFESAFHELFLERLDARLRPPADQVIFPSIHELDRATDELAAVPADSTYGGVGFHGHLAFNEPPSSPWTRVALDQLRRSRTRILALRTDTLIALAQRKLGGNVYGVPPMAMTLGMTELLSARRLRLYTDGGAWKQTIMRILLFAEPTVDFPVTLASEHPDVHVTLDAASATPPPEAWWHDGPLPALEARTRP
jgi:glucosamine-6-phosphate deaminase